MLLYNKALDINHTFLRLISLLLYTEPQRVEKDKLRIFDFLITNPAYVTKISLKKEHSKAKGAFKGYENSYQNYDAIRLFENMRPIQEIVIHKLLDMKVFLEGDEKNGYLVDLSNIPVPLRELALNKDNSISYQVIAFIKSYLIDVSLTGPEGLKCLSKLMEYRYDVV